MARACVHYERAFEAFVRAKRIPYVAVSEARKALLPTTGHLAASEGVSPGAPERDSLKSFDFVVYGQHHNLLVDVKGRKLPCRETATRAARGLRPGMSDFALHPAHHAHPAYAAQAPQARALPTGRLDSWVTQEDLRSLSIWQGLFGGQFRAAFVFVYWCEAQPPDGLFQEIIEHDGMWYALRVVLVDDYIACCKPRSAKWQTVDVPGPAFERISHPFAARYVDARPAGDHNPALAPRPLAQARPG